MFFNISQDFEILEAHFLIKVFLIKNNVEFFK